jgi:CheY-like chemotaxis protein
MIHTSTILIVDDEVGGRKALEGILRPYRYNLAFACDGAEALVQAANLCDEGGAAAARGD